MVDGGEPGVDSRDEGKHTGRNDQHACIGARPALLLWMKKSHRRPQETTRKRLSKTGSKQYFNQSLDYSSVTLQIAIKTFEL